MAANAADASVAERLAALATYVWGQCTYGVALLASWIPGGLGDAKDWLANAQAKGFATTNIPTVGSVAVYGAGHGYSTFGHVAAVEAVNADGTFIVREMNMLNGVGQWDTRTSSMNDVLGFILPPGTAAANFSLAGANTGLSLLSAFEPTKIAPGFLSGLAQTFGVNNIIDLVERWLLIVMGMTLIVIALIMLTRVDKVIIPAATTAAKAAI